MKKSVYYSSLVTFLVVFFLFGINFSFAINHQSLTKYSFFGITIFTTILTLLYFNNQGDKNVFINSLYVVLKLILFHSLLSFLAYFFVKDSLVLITSKYHESLTYNYLFYYSVKTGSVFNVLGLDLCRNSGIFWEPGILQGYLNILFFLEFSVFKRNKILLVLIAAAILSTYSTTGLFLLMIQLIYFLQKEFKKNIALVLIMIICIPFYILLSSNMNEKIYGEGESSFQKRLIDLTQPLFIAFQNPLTGVGLDIDSFQKVREEFYINSNLNNVLRQIGIEQKSETTSKGSTNSVMYMLAGMGFPTAILFIFMFIKQQIVKKDRFIWFVITFFTVMSEPLLLRPFFFIFILSGFFHFVYNIAGYKKQLA
ncbi:MAG: O-antigen ligase family protein [Bacteroidota bacterium]|nr:O-antigen ligase family protein [Bacteroidota bacterium]